MTGLSFLASVSVLFQGQSPIFATLALGTLLFTAAVDYGNPRKTIIVSREQRVVYGEGLTLNKKNCGNLFVLLILRALIIIILGDYGYYAASDLGLSGWALALKLTISILPIVYVLDLSVFHHRFYLLPLVLQSGVDVFSILIKRHPIFGFIGPILLLSLIPLHVAVTAIPGHSWSFMGPVTEIHETNV